MTTHTPGPWTVEDPMGAEIGLSIVQSGLKTYEWEFIAMVCQSDASDERVGRQRLISQEEQEANARLIAAAPDMFDLLHRNYDAWDNEEESVKEEHEDLMAELSAFLDSMPTNSGSPNIVAVMLVALRRAEYQLAEEVERRGDEDKEYESPMSPVLDQVRAAIARAEGREG